MDEKNRLNVLILDPETDTAELFARSLETRSRKCKCYWVKTPHEARGLIAEIPFSFLLADFSVLEQDGFLLFESVREAECKTAVIVNSYLNRKENIKKAIEMGAAAYFVKPITVSSLRKLIADLSEAHEMSSG